ncbi:MAG TPA: ferredoxin [Candidatus Saccharimonadales bacterium]
MKVWIDQDLCTGDGLCTEICPSVFEMHNDGLAYVKGIGQTALCDENGIPINRGAEGLAEFDPALEDSVHEAISECPGECIYIERDK